MLQEEQRVADDSRLLRSNWEGEVANCPDGNRHRERAAEDLWCLARGLARSGSSVNVCWGKRTRTGRTKGRGIIQFGMLVTQIPKHQAKLHTSSPFPQPPSHSWSPGSHNHKETSWAQRKWKADSIRAGSLILKWLWGQEALFSPQQWGWTHTTVLFGFRTIRFQITLCLADPLEIYEPLRRTLSLSIYPVLPKRSNLKCVWHFTRPEPQCELLLKSTIFF